MYGTITELTEDGGRIARAIDHKGHTLSYCFLAQHVYGGAPTFARLRVGARVFFHSRAKPDSQPLPPADRVWLLEE